MKTTRKTAAVMAALILASACPVIDASDTSYSFGIECSAAETELSAPANVKEKVNGNAVILSWDEVEGANSYRIYKYNAGKKKYVKYKTVTGTKAVIKDLDEGTAYKFKVAALQKKGRTFTAGKLSKAITVDISTAEKSDTPKSQKTALKEVNLSAKELAGAWDYYDFRYLSDISKSSSYDPSAKEWAGSGYIKTIQFFTEQYAIIAYEDEVCDAKISAISKKLDSISYKTYTDGTDYYLFYSFKNGDGNNTYVFKKKVHSTFKKENDTSLLEGKWTVVDFCQTDIAKNTYDPTSPIWLWDFYMTNAEAKGDKITFYYSDGYKSEHKISDNKIDAAKYIVYSIDNDLYMYYQWITDDGDKQFYVLKKDQ